MDDETSTGPHAVAHDGELDRTIWRLDLAPDRAERPVTEDTASIGLHDGGSCCGQRFEPRPPGQVHGPVELVEIPDPQTVLDAIVTDTSLDQLRPVDQTALRLGDPSNLLITDPANPL
jgi:hypothetical protein